ncbi:DUF2459 domain-containing protein [Caulobacter sp. 17J80-11]|uniref:DUF2459 domain-containing protein n=1 Tax=Caulobacter sp. 17J80-11 TaxID=2763502 RepID=UPI001653B2C2|nr:DUF2459 domain-containing protein [Caulobacter sp. 17J80-11]MBC6982755.1 DUF2459 domain-containing protein [Caulobacter sp. 17J80-11]
MTGRARALPIRLLVALGVAGLLLLALLSYRRPGDPQLYPVAPGQPAVVVYVVDNGMHTNLALPTEALKAHGGPSAQALARLKPSPWVLVGWGDARFYVESGMSPARALDALRALFAPGNRSVVMLGPLHASPDKLYSTGVVKLRVSPEGFERLAERLDRSFALRDGAPQGGPVRGWGDAHFFESVETFSYLHLCNHWIAELLNAAGLPVRPGISTVPAGLVHDLKTRAGALDTAAPAR